VDEPDVPLVLPDEPDDPDGLLVNVGAGPEVEGELGPPLDPVGAEGGGGGVGAGTTVAGTMTAAPVVVSTSVTIVGPPEGAGPGAGTIVTGTLTVAPVVMSTSVSVVAPPPEGIVTGIMATVEPPSGASKDGSVTTSMPPDKPGPVVGGTG
jgi:hypothetical protein